MKKLALGVGFTISALAAAVTAQSAIAADHIPDKVRVVIGSKSTGGDTYQSSSIIAEALSEKLGASFKVDAVGSTAGFKAIERRNTTDGSTIMIFHDQAYLGYLYGRTGYENPFENYRVGPLFAINPGNGYLSKKGSEFNSMEKILNAACSGTPVRVAIQPGGTSEIGFSGLKNAARIKCNGQENIVAVNTGSQSSKNQAMWDGLADVINGSVQANEQYTRLDASDQKAMDFVWLTARNSTIQDAPEAGMGQTNREALLQFVEPNVEVTMGNGKNFTFDKEFYFLFNKDISDEFVAELDQALTEIFAEGKVQEVQKRSFFIPNFKPSAEASAYLQEKSKTVAEVLEAIK